MATFAISDRSSPLTAPHDDRECAYPIDARLDRLVDSTVSDCIERGDSVDETADVVAALVRTTAPSGLVESDPEWETRWRSYFAFYDHAVMHAIRSYVEREVGCVVSPR